MSAWRTGGLVLAWGIAALWSTRAAMWLRGMQRLPDLLRNPLPAPRSRLSVIVPARNEGAAVANSLRSLLHAQDIDLEVIAVDDRSTDETGAVIRALEAEPHAQRVGYRVEHVVELPEGWLGKPHAMACGAERATGEWLLFTDADVWFAPDALARALAYVEQERADHLLLMPTMLAKSAGESMMLAYLHVLSTWGPRLWRVADPRARRDSVGMGAFNMVRRSAYEAIGGWAALRMEVVEDLRLGYLLKRAGFACRVATGRNLVQIRWARGAAGVMRNLTKNIFAGFRFRLPLAMLGTAGTAVLCLMPFAAVVAGLSGRHAWLWPGLLGIASVTALYCRYHHHVEPGSRWSVLWVATFPLACLLFVYTMVRSTVLTLARGGVVWRGTFYPLKELREHAGPLR